MPVNCVEKFFAIWYPISLLTGFTELLIVY